MKTRTTLATIIFSLLISLSAFSQIGDSEVVTIHASISATIYLNLETTPVVFDFTTLSDYQNGISADKSAGTNATAGNVVSTTNWSMALVAQSEMIHVDGISTMSLENVGVTVDFTGSNHVKNYAKNTPVALASTETMILGQQGNQSNAGDEKANSFIIYWEMGTGEGNLKSETLLEQNLKHGTYNVDVAFVVSEII